MHTLSGPRHVWLPPSRVALIRLSLHFDVVNKQTPRLTEGEKEASRATPHRVRRNLQSQMEKVTDNEENLHLNDFILSFSLPLASSSLHKYMNWGHNTVHPFILTLSSRKRRKSNGAAYWFPLYGEFSTSVQFSISQSHPVLLDWLQFVTSQKLLSTSFNYFNRTRVHWQKSIPAIWVWSKQVSSCFYFPSRNT